MRIEDMCGNTLNLSDELIAVTHNIVVDNFQQEISPRSVVRMSEIILLQTEDILAQVRNLRKPVIDCQAGCYYCCCAYVTTTTLETLQLVAYIRSHFSDREIEELKQRTANVAAKRRGLTADAQEALRVYCPLLVDNKCSVYAARPLPCRGWTSGSVTACRHNAEQTDEPVVPIPYYRPYKEITTGVRVGVQSGLDQTPLQNDDLELAASLEVALDMPDIIERWLTGEEVFPESTWQKDDEH